MTRREEAVEEDSSWAHLAIGIELKTHATSQKMQIALRILYLVTAILCNFHSSLEREIPRRSFLSRRAIDGSRGRKYFNPQEEDTFDSYGSAGGGEYEPYAAKEDHNDIRMNVPGEPGVDYPAYSTLPQTGFTCEGRSRGYYADEVAGCQVFHVCHDILVSSFLCPIGSLFSQKLLTCDWWTKVDCSQTTKFVQINRHGHSHEDDDEMIRKAYTMMGLQPGKDVTSDELVDPDAGGRITDYVTKPVDSPNTNELRNNFFSNFNNFRIEHPKKTTYQHTFYSQDRRFDQENREGFTGSYKNSYDDSPVVRINKIGGDNYREPPTLNRFQPSYAPTVPTVTTTTRRFYSPTIPTTSKPSTLAYNKLDQILESSERFYTRSDESKLEEDEYYSDDIETKESIGLARSFQSTGKFRIHVQDTSDNSKDGTASWRSPQISQNVSVQVGTITESSPLIVDTNEDGRNRPEDYFDHSDLLGSTTTVSYETQEYASTLGQIIVPEENNRKVSFEQDASVFEKDFNSSTIPSEQSFTERSITFDGYNSQSNDSEVIPKPDGFLKPPLEIKEEKKFRIHVPDYNFNQSNLLTNLTGSTLTIFTTVPTVRASKKNVELVSTVTENNKFSTLVNNIRNLTSEKIENVEIIKSVNREITIGYKNPISISSGLEISTEASLRESLLNEGSSGLPQDSSTIRIQDNKNEDNPQEFKQDSSSVNALSLLQLMAELLKIDNIPRPFASSNQKLGKVPEDNINLANINEEKLFTVREELEESTEAITEAPKILRKDEILERLTQNFGHPLYNIENHRLPLELPQVQRSLNFETGLLLEHEYESQFGSFNRSDSKSQSLHTLESHVNLNHSNENTGDIRVFKDIENLDNYSGRSTSLNIANRTETSSTSSVVVGSSTESVKTVVETEFVPSLGFSLDTNEGREEYVEAVLGGLFDESSNKRKEKDKEDI